MQRGWGEIIIIIRNYNAMRMEERPEERVLEKNFLYEQEKCSTSSVRNLCGLWLAF